MSRCHDSSAARKNVWTGWIFLCSGTKSGFHKMSDRNIRKLAKVILSIHPIFHSQVDSRSPVIVQKSKKTPKVSEQFLCFNFFNSFL